MLAPPVGLSTRARPLRSLAFRLLLACACLLALAHFYHLHRSSSSSFFSQSSSFPRAVSGKTITFTTYLDARFSKPDEGESRVGGEDAKAGEARTPAPHLWLTVADGEWIETGTAALELFVRELNAEREARLGVEGTRRTELVTLCLDRTCIDVCKARDLYCYGGFMSTQPIHMQQRDWFKVAGVTDTLRSGRDGVFYVESDVNFKLDPYPMLEPFFDTADLLIAENATSPLAGHVNSGFFWMRSSETALEMWKEVLERSLPGKSRAQDEINQILGTTELRQPATMDEPLRTDFVAANGLRVHVLDPATFRPINLQFEKPESEQREAVSLQMTCGGDMLNRVFIAQAQGYWPDLNGYYTAPPSLIKIRQLTGNINDNLQILKILFAAARYSGRSVEPPALATFVDLDIVRPIYSAFPFPHLSRSLSVAVVEPSYISHAIRHLTSAPVPELVVPLEHRKDTNDSDRLVTALQESAELDIRNCESLSDLIHRLVSSSYSREKVVTLSNFDSTSNWRRWKLPAPLTSVAACEQLEVPVTCGEVCRRSATEEEVVRPWPSREDVMAEPAVVTN